MRVVLAGRAPDPAACARWIDRAPSSPPSGPPDATVDRYRAQVPVESGTAPQTIFERVRERLLEYDIFPPAVMLHGLCRSGPIQFGSTIVQRVQADSLFALEMAVRVTRTWDTESAGKREAGFTYVTLEGHAECGVESFRLQLDHATQAVALLIDARSKPGVWLTRLGFPIARIIQRSLTQAAVRRLTHL